MHQFGVAWFCKCKSLRKLIKVTNIKTHVISVHVTESSEDCELKCYLEDDCMSINIEPKGDGTYYYELSDSDHVLHPRDLENRKDVINRSVQVRICRFN